MQRELEFSKWFTNILENMQDAFVALDRNWRYTYVNRKAAQMLNRDPGALIGKHIWTEFPEGVGQRFHRAYERAMAGQQPVQIEEYYPPHDRWLENRILPTEQGLAIFFTDITERKHTEALLASQKRALEMIAAGAPLAQALDMLVRILEEQTPEMLGSILLLDADGVHLRHGAAPSLPERFVQAIDGEAIGDRAGSCGTAAFRCEPVIVEDIATDPLWESYRHLAAAENLRACWSTPIFDAQQRVLGTFAMYLRTPGRPTERHLKLIAMATHIAAIAITKSRGEAELRNLVSRLRELSRRLLEVEEEERRRINREVHDRVSQNLSALNLALDTTRARLSADSLLAVGNVLDDSSRLLAVTIAQVRDVMADLRPVALDDFGLLAALQSYAEPFSKRVGVPVEVTGKTITPRLSPIVETALFRIAQEALHNVAKHACASRVSVILEAAPDRVLLSVIDDGVGFRPEESGMTRASWGVTTMRERAEAIGAALRIDSAPGKGTRVTVEVARSS
jgi:PAS domain S-box-containing protein